MEAIRQLINSLKPAEIDDVRIGLHWIGVTARVQDKLTCGLASTVPASHDHRSDFDVPEAGRLAQLSGLELAEWALSDHPTRTGVGLAAINAMLEPCPDLWEEINAEQVILRYAEQGPVGLLGRFPFIPRLREKLKQLYVFELNPQPGEYGTDDMKAILPDCAVVAITGMTLVNHTFEKVISYRSPDSISLVMGPTTPVSPVLFDYGIDLISGTIVEKIEPVMRCLSQGGAYRQLHQAGTRLVTIQSPRLKQ
ncbi:MAG: DUF364 domain-containing protein [Chloroflexi bacterium]|nr:DUF364 domain-containing protein [Chloroflexota bacterium]